MKSKQSFLIILLGLLSFTEGKANKINSTIAQKAMEWNEGISSKNFEQLRPLYDVNVICYGMFGSLQESIARKTKYYSKFSSYRQSIVSDFTISTYPNGFYRCAFYKQVSADGKTKKYPSYLIFKEIDGEFKITEEGDEITNSNVNYQPSLGTPKKIETVALGSHDNGKSWWLIIMIAGATIGLLFLIFRGKIVKPRLTIAPMPQTAVEGLKNSLPRLVDDSMDERLDENGKKGYAFEQFMAAFFDVPDRFILLNWQGDKRVGTLSAEANRDPDLIVQLIKKRGLTDFAVECKYRSKLNTNYPVQLCEERQFRNYQNFGRIKNMDVFIALGIGGDPAKPDELYLIPIMNLNSHLMNFEVLQEYKKYGRSIFYDPDAGTLR